MPWFRSAVFAALAATAITAQAQAFPTKPIRLVCPFPPGGAVDIASRAIAAELSKTIGQPVNVENRPGAGGNIGGAEVARASADGYTLLMTTSGINAINPVLYRKMSFDPNKDLTPVVALVSLSNVLVVHPSVKANNVGELLAMLKAQPGQMTFASSGSGTSIHMSGEMFMHLTGTRMVHVPYKGSAPAITDLLGGQVQMMFDNIPSALPHIRSGKLRALATTGASRDPALPELPTIAEVGITGYVAGVWFGLAAPAGTPEAVVNKISAEAIKGTKSPDFIKRMTELGYVIMGEGPAQMTSMIRAEIDRWTPVVKASGAVAE